MELFTYFLYKGLLPAMSDRNTVTLHMMKERRERKKYQYEAEGPYNCLCLNQRDMYGTSSLKRTVREYISK